jgi:hypothetical protein
MTRSLIALGALTLAGCQTISVNVDQIRAEAAQYPTARQADIPVARTAVTRLLKDPSSARFPGDEVLKPNAVCGTVSAKNSFGGYGNPAFYVYLVSSQEVRLIDTNDTTYSTEKVLQFEAYKALCS